MFLAGVYPPGGTVLVRTLAEELVGYQLFLPMVTPGCSSQRPVSFRCGALDPPGPHPSSPRTALSRVYAVGDIKAIQQFLKFILISVSPISSELRQISFEFYT